MKQLLLARKAQQKGDVFDAQLGADLRDEGIARVSESTAAWQEKAVSVVRDLSLRQHELTTDDVWLNLGGHDPGLEGRAMGAVMRRAASLGYVKSTPLTTKSVRAACHRRDLRIWSSLLWRGR